MAHQRLRLARQVWAWGARPLTCRLSVASRFPVQSIPSLCIWPGAGWAGCLGQMQGTWKGTGRARRRCPLAGTARPWKESETNRPSCCSDCRPLRSGVSAWQPEAKGEEPPAAQVPRQARPQGPWEQAGSCPVPGVAGLDQNRGPAAAVTRSHNEKQSRAQPSQGKTVP